MSTKCVCGTVLNLTRINNINSNTHINLNSLGFGFGFGFGLGLPWFS